MSIKKNKVAIIYHHIPEFRQAIFNKLSEETEIEYVVISDIETIIPALKLVDQSVLDSWGKHFIRVKNLWIGDHLLWQTEITKPSFIRQFDTLIYLGSMYHISTWVSALTARIMGKQVTFWTHGLINREDSFKGIVRRLFYRIANNFLLYGHRAKKLLKDYGFSSDKLFVVYNSLDYEKQKKYRNLVSIDGINNFKKKYFKDYTLPLVIFVGRLTSEKQPELVVELAMIMKERGAPINVLIVGDGPDCKGIKLLINNNNISDNIHMYGACHNEKELSTLLVGSDLSIIPGFVGLAAMHYMAYGLPVITSDNLDEQKPEVEAIIQDVTGGFFKHGNTSDLADVTSHWLSKDSDQVRQNCISMIEKVYNPDVQAEIINHLCSAGTANTQPVKELKI